MILNTIQPPAYNSNGLGLGLKSNCLPCWVHAHAHAQELVALFTVFVYLSFFLFFLYIIEVAGSKLFTSTPKNESTNGVALSKLKTVNENVKHELRIRAHRSGFSPLHIVIPSLFLNSKNVLCFLEKPHNFVPWFCTSTVPYGYPCNFSCSCRQQYSDLCKCWRYTFTTFGS